MTRHRQWPMRFVLVADRRFGHNSALSRRSGHLDRPCGQTLDRLTSGRRVASSINNPEIALTPPRRYGN
jgi:hypothetical protein